MNEHIKTHIEASVKVKQQILSNDLLIEKMNKAIKQLVKMYRLKGKLLLCGNGGSTCDALHIAEELTGKYKLERPPLAAIALSEAAHITCTANDYGFDAIFLRALQALGKSGDCLIALSTSGNSKNVIEAAKYAKANQIFVIALTGLSGGVLKNHADIWINVPSDVTAHIQEAHITIGHLIIENVEQTLFNET